VLMDMQMPIMDGLEATRHIRDFPTYSHTPIIAMTANAFIEDKQRCLDVGMNDFLSKPVDPNSLYAMLGQWLPSNRPFSKTKSTDAENNLQVHPQVLNSEKGLGNLGGTIDSYQRLLTQFIDLHANDPAKIQDALHTGDRKTAHRIAHTLKGVSATLGIEQVYEQAFKLDRIFKNGADNDTLLPEVASLHDSLRLALPMLRAFIEQSATADPVCNIDADALPQLLQSLHEQLSKDNIKSAETWRTLRPLMVDLLGEDVIAQLDQQISHYDLPSAVATLKALSEAYPQLMLGQPH